MQTIGVPVGHPYLADRLRWLLSVLGVIFMLIGAVALGSILLNRFRAFDEQVAEKSGASRVMVVSGGQEQDSLLYELEVEGQFEGSRTSSRPSVHPITALATILAVVWMVVEVLLTRREYRQREN